MKQLRYLTKYEKEKKKCKKISAVQFFILFFLCHTSDEFVNN